MKALLTTLMMSVLHAQSEEEIAVKAASGRFEVAQSYEGDRDRGEGEFVETLRFSNSKLSAVRLAGASWPGVYSISPDEHWLLRVQKTGSGDNVAMLYQIKKNGRVLEVLGFDNLLWSVSDKTSRLKQKELYHTRITDWEWSGNSGSLVFTLKGSNTAKSGDGIECRIIYDLKTGRAVVEPSKE
ncbi:hypothetical protein [Prosthecobacter sp.]|uniref:hypothetical protein n=1 Tax=Prosthecobacter sp. TaxID=1965333 RepID=UPI003783C34D